MSNKAIVNVVFPSYNLLNTYGVLRITGERTPLKGVTIHDAASSQVVVDGQPTLGDKTFLTLTSGKYSFEDILNTKINNTPISEFDLRVDGGIPVATTWHTICPELKEKDWTLGKLKDAMESGRSLEIMHDYPWTYERMVRAVGEKTFEKAYGYNLETLFDASISEFKKFGADEIAKKYKIPYPNWRLINTQMLLDEDNKHNVLIHEGARLPYAKGNLDDHIKFGGSSDGYIVIGRSPYNKNKRILLVVGARGCDIQAGSAVVEGTTYEIPQNNPAFSSKHNIRPIIGANQLSDIIKETLTNSEPFDHAIIPFNTNLVKLPGDKYATVNQIGFLPPRIISKNPIGKYKTI